MNYRSNTIRYRKMNPRQTVGIILLVFTSVLPALLLTGFLPLFNFLQLSFSVWLIIALLGGALGGSLLTPRMRYWYVGLIAGILIGPGMLIATYYYTAWRSSILNIEILIPILLGALPGLLFVFIVVALFGKKRRAQKPTSLHAQQQMLAAPYSPNAYPPQPYVPTQPQQSFQPYQQPPSSQAPYWPPRQQNGQQNRQ